MSDDTFKFHNPRGLKKPEGPPYKAGNGQWLTKALFFENYRRSISSAYYLPVFCLKHDWDSRRSQLIEFHSTFLEERDPTGYRWAQKYLGSYEPFKQMRNAPWFKDFFENEVLPDLHELMKSEALAKVRDIMENGSDGQALAAAKYIAEEGWKKKRGRPTKAEVEGEIRRKARLTSDEEDDLKRIGLVVDNTKEAKPNAQ